MLPDDVSRMRRQRADLSLPIGRSPFMAPEIWDACACAISSRRLGRISLLAVDISNARALSAKGDWARNSACLASRTTPRTATSAAHVLRVSVAHIRLCADRTRTPRPRLYRRGAVLRSGRKLSSLASVVSRLVRRLNDRGRPDLYSASSRALEPTTYRARITCNSSPGAGCARNGLLRQPPFWTATAFSFRKSLPRWATMKFCSTAAPTMALWLRPFCGTQKGNFLAGS